MCKFVIAMNPKKASLLYAFRFVCAMDTENADAVLAVVCSMVPYLGGNMMIIFVVRVGSVVLVRDLCGRRNCEF